MNKTLTLPSLAWVACLFVVYSKKECGLLIICHIAGNPFKAEEKPTAGSNGNQHCTALGDIC